MIELIRIDQKPEHGYFLRRPNKFIVEIKTRYGVKLCHLRDTGRLKKLLFPNNEILYINKSIRASRKTSCEILAAWHKDTDEWVLINPGFHNDIVEKIISAGLMSELRDYFVERREVTYKSSRIDFLLHSAIGKKALLEVKGCTLFINDIGYYPDAPTKRGTKHVKTLAKALKNGLETFILFIVPGRVKEVRPNHEIDPKFAIELKKAVQHGVKALAARVKLIKNIIYFNEEIPVRV